MKKKILGIIMPFILSLLCGYVCGKYIYNMYNDNIYNDLRSMKLYLVQNGEYDNYNDMREENSNNNYIYYMDDDRYKTIVGITRNYDNISKIKSLYSNDLVVNEYYIPVKYLDSRQDEYDKVLYDTNNVYEVKEIVDNILNLYMGSDSIKLIAIN